MVFAMANSPLEVKKNPSSIGKPAMNDGFSTFSLVYQSVDQWSINGITKGKILVKQWLIRCSITMVKLISYGQSLVWNLTVDNSRAL